MKKISEEKLLQLLKNEAELRILEAGGVDNWEGYSMCFVNEYEYDDNDDLDLVRGKLTEEEIKNILSNYEDA